MVLVIPSVLSDQQLADLQIVPMHDDDGEQQLGDGVSDLTLEQIMASLDFSDANLWDARESFKHWFNLDGILAWDLVIMTKYVKDAHATFPIFKTGYDDPAGKPLPLHKRSSTNDRDEHETRERYKRSIRVDGYQQNARSRTVSIPYANAPHPECRDLLAAAHCYEALVECAYENLTAEKKNPKVQLSVQKSLVDCIDLDERTPSDVQEWVVRNFNKFNCGSGANMAQTINVRVKSAMRCSTYKDSMGLSVSKCGGQASYEAMHRSWLSDKNKCPVFQKKWEWYAALGKFLNSLADNHTGDASLLVKNQNIENFKAFCNRFIDNLQAQDKLEVICRNITDVDRVLKKHYASSMDDARFNLVWMESVKACMPLAVPDHVWAVDSYNWSHPIAELLATSMETGKRVVLIAKTKAKAKAKSKPKAKSGRKAKDQDDAPQDDDAHQDDGDEVCSN